MLATDVQDYLTAQGAANISWPAYVGFMPDDTDQAIGIFESGGYPADTLQADTETVTIQIRVRGMKLDYATARQKWQDCFTFLQDAQQTAGSPILLPGVVFIKAMHYGPLAWNDEKGRPNMTVNFRVFRYISGAYP